MRPPSRKPIVIAVSLAAALAVALAAVPSRGKSYTYLQVFHEVLGLTRANYVEPTDEAALLEGAYRGMVGSLDVASGYLAPGEEKELQTPLAQGRLGLAALPSGGAAVIVRVDPGGPAEKAGLAVGDQIWRVGDKSARALPYSVLERRLAGPVGQTLSLQILDAATFKLKDLQITLAARPTRGCSATYQRGAIYLRMADLEQIDAAALMRELGNLRAQHPTAPLLVDLRGVIGLELAPLARLSGVLYGGGPLAQLVTRQGATESISAPESAPPQLGALHVLVDGSTAGVGEALALLLKEKAGATLYGRTTFGLGGVPELISLTSGGSVLLTTREMRTASGKSWSSTGIEPKTVLTPTIARGEDDATPGKDRDPMLEEMFRQLQLKPAPAQRPAA